MKSSTVSRIVSWALAVIWTVLICYLLLWPSKGTVKDVSELFGGTDKSDAVGHFGLAFVEAGLLFSLFRRYFSVRRAWLITIVGTFALGTILELAQNWIPDRGFTLMDLSANLLGIVLFVFVSRTVLPSEK